MFKRGLTSILLVLALGVALAACGGSSSSNEGGESDRASVSAADRAQITREIEQQLREEQAEKRRERARKRRARERERIERERERIEREQEQQQAPVEDAPPPADDSGLEPCIYGEGLCTPEENEGEQEAEEYCGPGMKDENGNIVPKPGC